MPVVATPSSVTPLAAVLRPKSLDDIIGQDHLVGPGKPLRKMATKGVFCSIIFWGPTGTGKTSIVRALAADTGSIFRQLNATEATVKDLRAIIVEAKKRLPQRTFVFLDEAHRWNKVQQDVMLPVVEDGTIVLFGATTEKPAFAVNSTILSRCLVMEVKPLDTQAMINLIKRVKAHYADKGRTIKIDAEAAKRLITRASGDARKAIMALETAIEILADTAAITHVTLEHIDQALPEKHLVFDVRGNEHYDLAHCYQEAIQNSDVDGALYWLGKWIVSGEDPAYICRRMLITSFEDAAGNPFAWLAAMAASYATERTGLPECLIPMGLATCEMAMSKRDKSAYHAIKEVMSDIEEKLVVHVPPGLRAGTSGYVPAVRKRYLKGWRKDLEVLNRKSQNLHESSHEFSGTIVYAIGHKDEGADRPGAAVAVGYGMKHGPAAQLDDMLAQEGDEGDYIIEFQPQADGQDRNREIYRWDGTTWKEIDHAQ
jgi:putative ATPase